MHRRAFVRVAAAALISAVIVAGTPAFASAGYIYSIWGWVTARQPSTASYTPGPKDQGNSTGGTNTVEHLGPGQYRVTFGGLDASCLYGHGCLGGAMATALSTTQRYCAVIGFSSSSPVMVEVYCWNRTGAFTDNAFSVNFLAPRDGHGTLAYLWADEPTNGAYYAPSDYDYNSSSQPDLIERGDTGYYHVYLTQQHAGTRGNLQVRGLTYPCRIERSADYNGNDSFLDVRCRDFAGNAADSQFYVTYTDGSGLKGVPGLSTAYVLANKPTTATYAPIAAFAYSSAGNTATVTRSSAGVYSVKLPGMPLGGSANVTSFGGTGKTQCQLSSIQKTSTPQRVGVRCFKPNGSPVDSKFYLTFTR